VRRRAPAGSALTSGAKYLAPGFTGGFNGEDISCQELYQAYVQWCNQNGYRPMNESNFGKEVKRVLPSVKKERRRRESKQTSIYSGIALRQDSEIRESCFSSDTIECA